MIRTIDIDLPVIDPTRRFYVSVIDGERYGLLLGPFTTHQEALDKVDMVRSACYDIDPRSPWYAFGTCSVGIEDVIEGRLNNHPLLNPQIEIEESSINLSAFED